MTANWTAPDEHGAIRGGERVCSKCYRGQCHACTGGPQGREFERPDAAAARLGASCLCAEQGHPTPVSCPEFMSIDQGRWTQFKRCDRKIKRVVQPTTWSGLPDHDYPEPIPLCGVHARMYEKRVTDAQARAAEAEAREKSDRRSAEQREQAKDAAAMLQQAVEDLCGVDLKADVVDRRSWGSVVGIDPEAAATLARYLMELG